MEDVILNHFGLDLISTFFFEKKVTSKTSLPVEQIKGLLWNIIVSHTNAFQVQQIIITSHPSWVGAFTF